MVRFIWVIAVSLPFIIYYILKAEYVCRHENRFSREDRYKIARNMVKVVKRNAFIRTKVYGSSNLPKEGGYVLYPNHQGKYDCLGIIDGHEKTCSVVVDERTARVILTDQFIKLLSGVRLNRQDFRKQVESVTRMREDLKRGRRFIIFPEGGYEKNRNSVRDFLPGAFKCAVQAKSPIVPVALIDSYVPFELNSLKPVTTQVHFLAPMYYEEYKEMNTRQIAEEVKRRITETIGRYS